MDDPGADRHRPLEAPHPRPSVVREAPTGSAADLSAARARAGPEPVVLDGGALAAATVAAVAAGRPVALDPNALARVAANRRVLEALVVREGAIYGVTTGFGALVDTVVPPAGRAQMQLALLRSHAAGTGAALPPEEVRAALAVRLNGMLAARSGVRPVVLEHVAALLNAGVVPHVPATGSLGASGDLAPSAHAFLVLVGEGEAHLPDGRLVDGATALAAAGLAPLELREKEGLALVNGTQFMAGIGALAAVRARRLAAAAEAVAAMSVEALGGTEAAFDADAMALRPLVGQGESAAAVRALLAGSGRTRRGPGDGGRVQDAYSLRCVPQVHGAAREALGFFERLVAVDLAAVTDNPVVFDDPPRVVSAGNFHGQSLALAFDTLRLALADLAAISERRTFRLLSPTLNGALPAFLTPTPGVASGLMVAQYTAAALVAELRALAHPVSVDTVPSSDSQEDHVAMGMTAATMTRDALERVEGVLAIELLCAAQALEWAPGTSSPALARVCALVRQAVPALVDDRPPATDIAALRAVVAGDALAGVIADATA